MPVFTRDPFLSHCRYQDAIGVFPSTVASARSVQFVCDHTTPDNKHSARTVLAESLPSHQLKSSAYGVAAIRRVPLCYCRVQHRELTFIAPWNCDSLVVPQPEIRDLSIAFWTARSLASVRPSICSEKAPTDQTAYWTSVEVKYLCYFVTIDASLASHAH